MKTKRFSAFGLTFVLGAILLASTGCQSDINGQTLPSGRYMDDDVQYFAPGLEHRAPREAAALSQAAAESQQRQRDMMP